MGLKIVRHSLGVDLHLELERARHSQIHNKYTPSKMTSPPPEGGQGLEESGVTIPTDSENYEANGEMSSSPPSSSSSPLILYSPPTLWGLLRGAAINLVLPFINGLMLGFGELFAHEAAFRLGWSGTKVRRNDAQIDLWDANHFPKIFPSHRSGARPVGPGVEVREDPIERRRRDGQEMAAYTSLE